MNPEHRKLQTISQQYQKIRWRDRGRGPKKHLRPKKNLSFSYSNLSYQVPLSSQWHCVLPYMAQYPGHVET